MSARKQPRFDLLPNEMLVYIASFLVNDDLSRCAFTRVCRRFYGVAHDTFDQGQSFKHVCLRGYTEIVRWFLADGRVDPTIDDNWAQRQWTCRRSKVAAG